MDTDKIKSLLAQDKIKESIVHIKSNNYMSKNNRLKDQLILIEARLSGLETSVIKGIITISDSWLYRNRIIDGLIKLLNKLSHEKELISRKEILSKSGRTSRKGKWFNKSNTPILCILYLIFAFELITYTDQAESTIESFISIITKLFLFGLLVGFSYSVKEIFITESIVFRMIFPIPLISFFIICPIIIIPLLACGGMMIDGIGIAVLSIVNILFNLLLGLFLGYSAICGNKLNKLITVLFYDYHIDKSISSRYYEGSESEFKLTSYSLMNIKIYTLFLILFLILSFRFIRLFV